MNLTAKWLGLTLKNPLASAFPLSRAAWMRQLIAKDASAATVIMYSLFERSSQRRKEEA